MSNLARPCIIGVAQKTWRPSGGDAPHPVLQAMEVAGMAADDCGNSAVLQYVDELDTVFPISWFYDDPCGQLATALCLGPGRRRLSGLSGTSAQRFINDAAETILRGEARAVLICGGEVFATLKRAKKEGRRLDWPQAQAKSSLPYEYRPRPTEITHRVSQAYATFAVLDSARRAKLGVAPEEYRRREAQMMARLSVVAARNPRAWFPKEYRADELFSVNPDNRMVAYPFTKNTMAFMDVDMAAAVIVASDALADELGVAQDKRVYLHGWDYAEEPPSIAEREELWRCPALETAGASALAMAGKDISDIQHLDLYSCFASSLNFTKDALGIAEQDPRPLTVTGGLPYFGGPGNNYTTHSVATLVEELRRHSSDFGLISGVGMHMTHHVFAVYGAARPGNLSRPSQSRAQRPTRTIVDIVKGPATIVAYTVLHDQHGDWALAICETPNGQRCYSHCTSEEALVSMEVREWVGQRVQLSHDNTGINRFL